MQECGESCLPKYLRISVSAYAMRYGSTISVSCVRKKEVETLRLGIYAVVAFNRSAARRPS